MEGERIKQKWKGENTEDCRSIEEEKNLTRMKQEGQQRIWLSRRRQFLKLFEYLVNFLPIYHIPKK